MCAVIAAVGLPANVAGQLRPTPSAPWRLLTEPATISAELGVARLSDQRASLAGTSGTLWEVGSFALAWRTGRVVIEVAGTGQRLFRERSRFAEPLDDVRPSDDGKRHDSGDYRVTTAVRLTSASSRIAGAFRFGTRLPTTDNGTGLDRDAVDFFATVGAALNRNGIVMTADGGIGIHGTRERRFEQDDLFLYALRLEHIGLPLIPSIEVLGQKHGLAHDAIRGVEDLGEARIGLRAGSRNWLRVEVVKGYESFSPSFGVMLTAGVIR